MADLTKIDERLRRVEDAVVRIETRMENFPTREWMWKSLAKGAALLMLAVGSGLLWLVKAYLAPIMAQLAKLSP